MVVDDLQFEVRRSARRKTLQITVERTGELILNAPPQVDEAQLLAFVQSKRFWVYTKLAERDRLQKQVGRKEFVAGAGLADGARGRLPGAHGSGTGWREGTGLGLPLGLLWEGGLVVLSLEVHPLARPHC